MESFHSNPQMTEDRRMCWTVYEVAQKLSQTHKLWNLFWNTIIVQLSGKNVRNI